MIWAVTRLCRPSGYRDYLWAGRPNLRRFFARRPISRPKIENFPRTKCQGISILHTHAKFQAYRFNNKKKYPKVVDPLNSFSRWELFQWVVEPTRAQLRFPPNSNISLEQSYIDWFSSSNWSNTFLCLRSYWIPLTDIGVRNTSFFHEYISLI